MNILQILPELNVGGVETGTVDFAKYLVEHGHRSIVVSSGGALVADLEQSGSKHYQLPADQKSLWTFLRCLKELEKIIRQEKVDIVHARSRVPAWIAFFACRRSKTAFVTTCHGYYSAQFFSRVMGWGKLVIAISEVIGRHMVHTFGTPPENIRLIPRSVDIKKFDVPRKVSKGKSEFIITIVGRITPLKGHDYFLKAMAQVVRFMPFVKVWVVGDAPASKQVYKEDLQVLVKRLGLTAHVEFLGNRRDVPQILAQTDVLVLSTVTQEAFGRVILEAQAAGVVVVATKVGGVVEIIEHEKTGLLVTPKDPEAMAQAVMRVLKDRKLADEMIKEARKKLESKYTVQQMAESTLRVYEEVLNSPNILVIKLSAVGDVVLTTAALAALRRKFPKAKIYCLVGKAASTILNKCPYLDGVIVYDYQQQDRGLKKLWALAYELRKYRIDKVIDFQNNRRSHILAALSFPRESYGYNNGKWGFLLTDKIKNDQPFLPPVEHQFRILKMLEIDYQKEDALLELWPSAQDDDYIQNLLDAEWLGHDKNFIGINLTASRKWQTKNWPVEYLARLCDLLAADNIRVVVTGEKKDILLARHLLSLTKAKPANFVGKTNILQLASLIKRCRAYLTPDSAPLHLAAAMNVPLVALFGPTDFRRHLPPAQHVVVLKRDLPCAPCYSTTCRIKTHACMKEIMPEEVFGKIRELMKKSNIGVGNWDSS